MYILTFASFGRCIQEVVSATFEHTLAVQRGVGRLAFLALSGTSTVQTVIITACRREQNI